MANAWMPSGINRWRASYTRRCRATRLKPAKRGLAIRTEKCRPSRAPAWPACRCESSATASAVGASAACSARSMSAAETLMSAPLALRAVPPRGDEPLRAAGRGSPPRLGRRLVLEVPAEVQALADDEDDHQRRGSEGLERHPCVAAERIGNPDVDQPHG